MDESVIVENWKYRWRSSLRLDFKSRGVLLRLRNISKQNTLMIKHNDTQALLMASYRLNRLEREAREKQELEELYVEWRKQTKP